MSHFIPDTFPNHYQSREDTFVLSFVGRAPCLAQAAEMEEEKGMQSISL